MQFDIITTSKQEDVSKVLDALTDSKMTITGHINPDKIEQLILSSFWPRAVHESMIVKSQDAISQRAKSIIKLFVGDISNKKFLDFGCGTGECTAFAKEQNAKLVIGYDPLIEKKGILNNFDDVKSHGEFDVILMFDVFDHIPEDKLEDSLKKIHSICHNDTIVKVRCHPWTSIHGGHLYEKLNKAFAHLFLTDEQIKKYQSQFVRKITRPSKVYNEAWDKYGFKVIDSEVHHSMEWDRNNKFFQDEEVSSFLESKSPQKLESKAEWQKHVLSIEFMDYTLKKN